MSHGESAAAGTRDDQPPWQPDDAFTEDSSADDGVFTEDSSADDGVAGDPVGEADAEPGELLAEPGDLDDPDDLAAQGGPAAGPAWSDGTPRGDGEHAEVTVADLEQEGEIAADYVEGLLDIADLDGDIDMDVEGDRALVSVVGGTLDELVGTKGVVLEALQELTRLAVQRQTGERTRMMLDVGGYRARRRAELTELGQDAADEVRQTGAPKRLTPMTAFERKVVHDAVAAAGLRSESEGEDPDRRVVVYPAE
jgi:spoIIIJ-associated protein